MTTAGRYTSINVSDEPCEGERFAPDGFPQKCEDTPVFELVHSIGRRLHVCEYHIECYWNLWLPFRDAIRDLWPVKKRISK